VEQCGRQRCVFLVGLDRLSAHARVLSRAVQGDSTGARRAPGRGRARRLLKGGRHAVAARAGRERPRHRGSFIQGWTDLPPRLEGGCHAGREDGELVAAVVPAVHAAPGLDEVRTVSRAPQDGEDGQRVARHVAIFVRVPAAARLVA
jgi:hypothetical protein